MTLAAPAQVLHYFPSPIPPRTHLPQQLSSMPEDWLEKQFENERRIRASLPPELVEAIGGSAGCRLLTAVDEKPAQRGTQGDKQSK